jgi:hypothetical protein
VTWIGRPRRPPPVTRSRRTWNRPLIGYRVGINRHHQHRFMGECITHAAQYERTTIIRRSARECVASDRIICV